MPVDNTLMAIQKKSKQNKKIYHAHKKHGFIFIAIGIILLTCVSGALGYHFNTWLRSQSLDNQRLVRIKTIYRSLSLGKEYQLESTDIFGDKRLYEWDKNRTYASSQSYVRGASVPNTATELRQKIEAAGFTFFEEPYPGSTYIQLHFKSGSGEYVRLSVSSKPRDDAIRNSALMSNSISNEAIELNKDTGPSNIVIKVNLDDNNE